MKKIKFLAMLFMAVMACVGFSACGDDGDDNIDIDDIENAGTGGDEEGGGISQKSYTLEQLAGYWVNEKEWDQYTARLLQIEKDGYTSASFFLDDGILDLVGAVTGYYLKEGKAYELYFEVTDVKYDNNEVAGNTIIKSWNFTYSTVYFMNTAGSKYNHTCSITDNDLLIEWNNHNTVLSTSMFVDSHGMVYKKLTRLSL